MRLTDEEVSAIKAAARWVFGESATVRLFGSRMDDSRRGGDIDLYVEAEDVTLQREIAFQMQLEDLLGEQKIDVVVHKRGEPLSPIDRVARRRGAIL